MYDDLHHSRVRKTLQKLAFMSLYDSLHAQITMQAEQNERDLKGVQRKSRRHARNFESQYRLQCARVAAQSHAQQEVHNMTTVPTEGIGAAAAAITGGIAKVAIGTAKLAGKTAVVAGTVVGKVAVATGKSVAKATVATGKSVAKASVKAEQAAQKSVLAAVKTTQKGIVAVEKTAIKALKKESNSHEDTEPYGTIDSPDHAKTFIDNITTAPTPVT